MSDAILREINELLADSYPEWKAFPSPFGGIRLVRLELWAQFPAGTPPEAILAATALAERAHRRRRRGRR